MNQSLRRLTESPDLLYIRQPFQDIFFEVIRRYVEQKSSDFRKEKEFSCYRACKISKKEFDDFSMNIGGFVQMEGFLSSSLEEDISLRYFFEKKSEEKSKNTLIEIVVKSENLGGNLDWGFASIKDSSYY